MLLPIFTIRKIYGKTINMISYNKNNSSVIHLNSVLNSNGSRLYQEFLNKNNSLLSSKYDLFMDILGPKFFDKFRTKIINERGLLNRINGSKYETKLLEYIYENHKNVEVKNSIKQFNQKHTEFTLKRQRWNEIHDKITESKNEIKSQVNKTNNLLLFFNNFLKKILLV